VIVGSYERFPVSGNETCCNLYQGRIQLVGGLGPSQGRNFDLKSGGTKLEAPKAPRIEMPKASREMSNGS